MLKRLPVPFSYIALTGAVLGLVIGFKTFIPYFYWGDLDDYVWYKSALPHLINYLFWPLLVPIIHYSFHRFELGRGASAAHVAAHVVLSLAVPFVHELVTTVIYFVLLEGLGVYSFSAETWSQIKGAFPSVYIGRMVEYWIIYGLFAAFDYYRQYKNKQAEVIRIESQLNRTKLAVLKMQLQPHFLFNALNSISSLMEIDVKKAQAVMARLGDLLRGILEQDERVLVSLEEELGYVRNYLEIERVRFGDRLQIHYEIDPSALSVQVPVLLLQPLAENAIKHGLAKKVEGGKLEISARREGENWLWVRVKDDGVGRILSETDVYKNGIGLANLKERLKALFGNESTFSVWSQPGQGFAVELKIPITTAHENH